MRRTRSTTLALAVVATAGLAVLAPAANAADTPVTFVLAGGALSVSAPTSTATLTGSALALNGSTMTGQLGTTTVTDLRGGLLHTVTVTMKSSDFTRTGGTETIPSSDVTGYSGVATPTGTAVPVPTLTGQQLAGAGSTILTVPGVVGTGGATYNPTVSVSVPASAVAGTYTGTITQTAS